MVLPFVAVIMTPIICSMADRNRSHRSFFSISLVLTALSMVAYSVLPLTITVGQHPVANGSNQQQHWWFGHMISSADNDSILVGPWIYYCFNSLVYEIALAVNTCLSDSFAVLHAEESGASFGRIIVWGTFGWASSALALSFINQTSFMPRLLPGLIFGTILLTIDVVIVSFWPRASDFKLDVIPIDAATTLTGSSSSGHREPSDYLPMNESARINLGREINRLSGSWQRRTTSPFQLLAEDRSARQADGKNKAQSIEESGPNDNQTDPLSVTIKTIDSDSCDQKGKEAPNVSPSTVVAPSSSLPDYAYCYSPTTTTKLSKVTKTDNDCNRVLSNIIIGTKNTTKDDKKAFKNQCIDKNKRAPHTTTLLVQMRLLGLILKRRTSLIRFFILFILSGFFMSMHWNYFFLYLEHIYCDKFELISALSMVNQSLLGELPFFILSRKFIDCLGRSHTVSLSMISIGLRFLLYNYLLPNASMYMIFVADCLQGPNYGLFYVVMTEVGLEYSFCDDDTIEYMAVCGHIDCNDQHQVDSLRLALRSTVQSVAFACYEGIGLGLGSLVGGWILSGHDFELLWLPMALASISIGLINIMIELFICSESSDPMAKISVQCEFAEARRAGTLRTVASPSAPQPPVVPLPLAPLKFHEPPDGRLAKLLAL